MTPTKDLPRADVDAGCKSPKPEQRHSCKRTGLILANLEGHIIAGHGRLQAARVLGLAELPVITLSDLAETQKWTPRIADNKIALNARRKRGEQQFAEFRHFTRPR